MGAGKMGCKGGLKLPGKREKGVETKKNVGKTLRGK